MSMGDHVVGYAVAFALGVVAMDHARDLRAEAAEQQKAEKAKPQARIEPAPIFSKRCVRRGQTHHATQADGGSWVVHCYGART